MGHKRNSGKRGKRRPMAPVLVKAGRRKKPKQTDTKLTLPDDRYGRIIKLLGAGSNGRQICDLFVGNKKGGFTRERLCLRGSIGRGYAKGDKDTGKILGGEFCKISCGRIHYIYRCMKDVKQDIHDWYNFPLHSDDFLDEPSKPTTIGWEFDYEEGDKVDCVDTTLPFRLGDGETAEDAAPPTLTAPTLESDDEEDDAVEVDVDAI